MRPLPSTRVCCAILWAVVAPAPAGAIPLNRDEAGKTTAWVRAYRSDLPGSGLVQLWTMGASLERLPMARAVAEYGLLRGTSDAARGKPLPRDSAP